MAPHSYEHMLGAIYSSEETRTRRATRNISQIDCKVARLRANGTKSAEENKSTELEVRKPTEVRCLVMEALLIAGFDPHCFGCFCCLG